MNRHALISEKEQDSESKTSPALPSPSAPISTLDSSLACTIYTNLHPFIVLSTFLFRFQSLVKDPTDALLSGLGILGILQTVYVVLCLPPTGSSTDSPPPKSSQKTPRGGRGKKPHGSKYEPSATSRIVPAVLSHLLATLLATPCLTLTLILFGAPLTTHLPSTVLCAAHMSTLSIMPLFYVHGVSAARWRQVAALMSPADEVFGAAVGTMLGAWMGAVPIPLDWDREWQRWPVTIVAGAYGGWALGKIVGGTVLRGKRLDLS